jgi:hypothetical protein
MGRVVHWASCPWGKLSMGRVVRGVSCPWGKLSMGRDVHGVSSHGASCHGANFDGASCPGIGVLLDQPSTPPTSCIYMVSPLAGIIYPFT